MSEVLLIDAYKAIKSIDEIVCSMSVCINSDYCHGMTAMKDAAIHAIEKQPTVDAVPVRHGEWLRTEAFPHRIYCSVCYKTYVPNDRWQIWEDDELPKNYCPNCGAKMDGADGERRS